MALVQPASKEPGRRRVPAAGVPDPVEAVGGVGRGADDGEQRRGRVRDRLGRGRVGVATAGELEQIGPLGPRQLKRLGQPAQGVRRDPNIAALLDPGAPGGADPRTIGELLAAQARRAPPPPMRLRRGPLAVGAHEGAQQGLSLSVGHGASYTRITAHLVPG